MQAKIKKELTIFLSGGGTLGPVTPLLAIYESIKKKYPEIRAVWFGTKNGPEKELVEKYGMKFLPIPTGKLRRYFSFWNLTDSIKIIIGFLISIKFIWLYRPRLCVSAGGFVSVPLHGAAWLFSIPTWIHQQDVDIGLAIRLMSPSAKIITVSLEKHLRHFSKKKTCWIGNPVRAGILNGSKEAARALFHLNPNKPVIFATGGGTGSLRVNQIVMEAVPHIASIAQVIHLSGKERPRELMEKLQRVFHDDYQVSDFFLEEMKHAYAIADIVISRGGFGTLSELAAMKKPSIIIPKPGHQEQNVEYLAKNNAVININEDTADGNYLAKIIKELLANSAKAKKMGITLHNLMPRASEDEIISIFENLTCR